MEPTLDFAGKRLLIFVVAYNAEKTIQSVLSRIPASLRKPNVEVLVIDDFSRDATFSTGLAYQNQTSEFKITMLRTPENQGYGGNQKLGYRYAIEHGFDIVALLHGDGQYAPEKLPDLVAPLIRGEADAVFGSRMIHKSNALKGGMPLYKWLGNQILTRFENAMLGTQLSEFHSGYRLYSTAALRKIPFERNSNDFHFDTDIIIQLSLAAQRIVEMPIPTFYGDEICHVNGMKYAWDIAKTMARLKCHRYNLLYDRKFDIDPLEETYDDKLGFLSSHTIAVSVVKPDARVLDIGCGCGKVAEEMAKTAQYVTGIDRSVPKNANPKINFQSWNHDVKHFPVDLSQYDQIFLLDRLERLRDPEIFMETIRAAAATRRSEIIITTANVAFFITRLMMLVGEFNYGRKGILNRTHTRLFTFRALRELLDQTDYEILELRGIPAPYPLALGNGWLGRTLLACNRALIAVSKGFFSYQIFIRAKARPTVANLLIETIETSEVLKNNQP